MTDKMITVGRIIAAHGIKGQVKIEVQSDNPLRFRKGQSLFVSALSRRLRIVSAQEHNGSLLVGFADIADRNAAESLVGSLLQVEESEVPPLPEGRYYYFQIEGMQVYDAADGHFIGVAEQVLEYGANDIFLIKREGLPDLLLPALKSTVNKLDIAGKRMEITVPEGLED